MNKITIALIAACLTMSSAVYAQDAMKKDDMSKNAMEKDGMAKLDFVHLYAMD